MAFVYDAPCLEGNINVFVIFFSTLIDFKKFSVGIASKWSEVSLDPDYESTLYNPSLVFIYFNCESLFQKYFLRTRFSARSPHDNYLQFRTILEDRPMFLSIHACVYFSKNSCLRTTYNYSMCSLINIGRLGPVALTSLKIKIILIYILYFILANRQFGINAKWRRKRNVLKFKWRWCNWASVVFQNLKMSIVTLRLLRYTGCPSGQDSFERDLKLERHQCLVSQRQVWAYGQRSTVGSMRSPIVDRQN